MTLDELIAEQRPILWPEDEQENLITAHLQFYQEALWSLNKWVECYRFNHRNVFPHCSTYFNCGMTVLPMVPGSITRIYAVDRVNEETGEEDPAAAADWCRKVHYNQVDYCHIQSYVRLCQRSNATANPNTADAIINALFGVFRRKRRYPKPTDEGVPTALPPLEEGFHYPQTSTDVQGRSPSGVWAIYRGRIYVAPWIQSTETLVIEWSGVKSKWSLLDPIEDDIKFKEAVRLFVAWKHESAYGEPDRAKEFRAQLFGDPGQGIPGALPEIQHECREQMRIRTCSTANAGAGAAARGIGTGGGGFWNDTAASFTAYCPAGKTGGPVTATVSVASVASPLSIADANAKAQQKAIDDATARLATVCSDAPPPTFLNNVEGRATGSCPAANGTTPAATPIGGNVQVVVPVGTVLGATQAEANTNAQNQAEALAHAQQRCMFHNAPQTADVECPAGTGDDTASATVPAGQFHVEGSQTKADTLAKNEASRLANALLVCTNTVTVESTPQSGIYSAVCQCLAGGLGPRTIAQEWSQPQGAVIGLSGPTPAEIAAVLALVNQQSREQGEMFAQQLWEIACQQYRAVCGRR